MANNYTENFTNVTTVSSNKATSQPLLYAIFPVVLWSD